jgi:hypothetical protein
MRHGTGRSRFFSSHDGMPSVHGNEGRGSHREPGDAHYASHGHLRKTRGLLGPEMVGERSVGARGIVAPSER